MPNEIDEELPPLGQLRLMSNQVVTLITKADGQPFVDFGGENHMKRALWFLRFLGYDMKTADAKTKEITIDDLKKVVLRALDKNRKRSNGQP